MNPLPLLAGGLALFLGARLLVRRRRRSAVRLRDGCRVTLVSSVALVGDSAGDLLALEYVSTLHAPTPQETWQEASSLVDTVGARAPYAGCRLAVVTVRGGRAGEGDTSSPERTFAFRRVDAGSGWVPAENLD